MDTISSFKFTTKSFLVISIIIGVILILLYGFIEPRLFVIKSSECLLLGFACMMIGVFVGFLFGIPKSISKNSYSSSGTYTSNTNLEEISDWLTKILVGLGLAQISFIPSKFESVVNYLQDRMPSINGSVIVSILIYFIFLGFFVGYLSTRLYLAKEFAKTEQDLQELRRNLAQIDKVQDKEFVIDKYNHPISNQKEGQPSEGTNDVITNIISQTKKIEESGGAISSEQYFKQGRVMLLNQNFQFAKEYFLKSYGLDKNYKAASNAAVISSKYLAQYDEAEKLLKELIIENPSNPLAYYNLACNYVRIKNFGDAIINLQKALELGKEIYIVQAKGDDTFIPMMNEEGFKKLLPDYRIGQ